MGNNLISGEVENELSRLKDGTITLSQWFYLWIRVHKHNSIRDSTEAYYIYLFEHYVAPSLGTKLLCEVSSLDCKILFNTLEDSGFSYSVRFRVRLVLDNLFKTALDDSYISRNPVSHLKTKKEVVSERRVLTVEEQAVFFKACRATFYENLFIVALCTGLRIGELSGLMDKDLDFDRRLIYVRRTMLFRRFSGDDHFSYRLHEPKTRTSKRVVPMTVQCSEALKRQIDLRDAVLSRPTVDPLDAFRECVFVNTRGKPVTSAIASSAIRSIVRDINRARNNSPVFEKFSAHTFRHTFATRCFEAGMDAKVVQNLLGHSSIHMTMDLYTHVTEEKQFADMAKLECLISNIENKSF